MHDTGQARFFVTIAASSADELRGLHEQEMDLFASTARRQKGRLARPFFIEGLLDEAEIATLRSAGYDVEIDAPIAERTAKPEDTLEFESWLQQMRELTAQDRTVE